MAKLLRPIQHANDTTTMSLASAYCVQVLLINTKHREITHQGNINIIKNINNIQVNKYN